MLRRVPGSFLCLSGQRQRIGNVVEYSVMRIKRERLRNVPEISDAGWKMRNWIATKKNRPGIGRLKSHDQPHQDRLPRHRRSKNYRKFPFLEFEVHIFEDALSRVAFTNILKFNFDHYFLPPSCAR